MVFLPRRETFKREFFIEKVSGDFNEERAQNWPKKPSRGSFLHLNNTIPHRAPCDLDRLGITRLPDPCYGRDLAPCGFWLFGTLKRRLKEYTFRDPVRVMTAVSPWLARFLLTSLFQCLANGNAYRANASREDANISKSDNSRRSVLFARENFVSRMDFLHLRSLPDRSNVRRRNFGS
jgi:hypothetical protein